MQSPDLNTALVLPATFLFFSCQESLNTLNYVNKATHFFCSTNSIKILHWVTDIHLYGISRILWSSSHKWLFLMWLISCMEIFFKVVKKKKFPTNSTSPGLAPGGLALICKKKWWRLQVGDQSATTLIERRACQNLKSGSRPCRNVLGSVNVTLLNHTHIAHVVRLFTFQKNLMTQCLVGGQNGAVDGNRREGAGNERKRKMQLWFRHFSLQARKADLPLPHQPHPPLLTLCCYIIDSNKIQFL